MSPSLFVLLILMPATLTALPEEGKPGATPPPAAKSVVTLRVAVVNGLARRGPWPALSTAFSSGGAVKVDTISGQREEVAAALREGRADVALMHKGEEADALVKEGIARAAVPWAASGFVLAGPKSDPAGIRGSKTAVEAMKRILTKTSPFVGPDGQGTRAMFEQTLTKSGVTIPAGWKALDPGDDAVAAASAAHAYFFAPAQRESLDAAGKKGIEIFITGDPDLRLEFVALAATKSANKSHAESLQKFLTSPDAEKHFGKPAGTEGRWMDLQSLNAEKTPTR
jgi:tungstate transport system substrate-binding protein